MPVVVDASAVVELLVRGPAAALVEAAVVEQEAWAPALLDAEVLHALARIERSGVMSPDRAAEAAADLADAPLERSGLLRLAEAAWRRRRRMSLYDAFYVALAAELGCVLVTADRRLAAACDGDVAVTLMPVRREG